MGTKAQLKVGLSLLALLINLYTVTDRMCPHFALKEVEGDATNPHKKVQMEVN
jgi:hypothetical protein